MRKRGDNNRENGDARGEGKPGGGFIPDGFYSEDEETEIEFADYGDEIEIGEDEEVEFVEWHPPFPGFPPPPAVLPPVPSRSFGGVKYAGGPADPDKGEKSNGEGKAENGNRHALKSVMAMQAEAMERIGKSQSNKIKGGRAVSALVLFFKCLCNAALLCVFIAGCYFIIEYYREKMIESSEETLLADKEEVKWRLEDSKANRVVRRYYDVVGPIEKSAKYSDMLLKGEVDLNGKDEDFYCIKRSNGRSYLRIGSAHKQRAYFIGRPSENVSRLSDMKVSGRKTSLPARESIVLRALSGFDEPIFTRAFGDGKALGEFVYDGYESLDGVKMEVVSIRESQMLLRYFFNPITGDLSALYIKEGANEAIAKFSDYRVCEDGVRYPHKKTVELNGKRVAELDITLAMRNRGFVFP